MFKDSKEKMIGMSAQMGDLIEANHLKKKKGKKNKWKFRT